MKKILLPILLIPTLCLADIAVEVQILDLFQSNGSPIPLNSVGILVASTTDTNFGQSDQLSGLNLVVGNTFASDDVIIGVIKASDFGGTNFGYGDNLIIPYSGNFNAGDKLGFYWFPTITGAGPVSLGSSYGFYRSDVVDTGSGGDIAFIAPVDGLTYTLAAFNTANGGSVTNAQYTANLTAGAVPEPSTYALMGLGIVFVGLMSRRKKA